MTYISETRREQIDGLLNSIEHDHSVSIILAVESGSRAWGFPSHDSDYDIRFIYHHPRRWYLSPFKKQDHIELTIENDLDASGWDIGKSLRLLYGGNCTLQEWLNGPLVYRQDAEKTQQLCRLAQRFFDPTAAFYHYYSLAKKKFLDDESRHNAKAFLYGLRALLCASWIVDRVEPAPVLFAELTDCYLSSDLKRLLATLLENKAKSGEQEPILVDNALWQFSLNLHTTLSKKNAPIAKPKQRDEFETVFQHIIGEMRE